MVPPFHPVFYKIYFFFPTPQPLKASLISLSLFFLNLIGSLSKLLRHLRLNFGSNSHPLYGLHLSDRSTPRREASVFLSAVASSLSWGPFGPFFCQSPFFFFPKSFFLTLSGSLPFGNYIFVSLIFFNWKCQGLTQFHFKKDTKLFPDLRLHPLSPPEHV